MNSVGRCGLNIQKSTLFFQCLVINIFQKIIWADIFSIPLRPTTALPIIQHQNNSIPIL